MAMQVSPETIQQVADLLSNCSSSNNETRGLYLETLSRAEKTPGFLSILLEIFANSFVAPEMRLLAVIQFKNCVAREWPKNESVSGDLHQLRMQEKLFLKQKLVSILDIADTKIAKQVAVILSKIARYDYPNHWGNLFPSLLNSLQSNSIAQIECTLGCIHQILKQLDLKRNIGDIQMVEQNARELAPCLRQIWIYKMRETINSIQSSSNIESARCALLSIKGLSFLIPKLDKKSADFLPALLEIMEAGKALWQLRFDCSNNVSRICDSILVHIVILVKKVIEARPYEFLDCLPSYFSFFLECLSTSTPSFVSQHVQQAPNKSTFDGELSLVHHEPTKTYIERFEFFIANLLSLFAYILSCKPYHGSRGATFTALRGITFDASTATEASKILNTLFTQDIGNLLQIVIQFLVMNSDELEAWQHDPEGYFVDEIKTDSLYDNKSRSAALKLLQALLDSKITSNATCSTCMNLMQQVLTNMPPNNHYPLISTPDFLLLLQKDAILVAFGCASLFLPSLKSDIPNLYQNFFSNELTAATGSHVGSMGRNIIYHRILCLLSKWGDHFSLELRLVLLRKVVLTALTDSDILVRLAGADLLESLMSSPELNAVHLSENGNFLCERLLALLSQLNELDIHIHVVPILKNLIERLEHLIAPIVPSIINVLPLLWRGNINSQSDQDDSVNQNVKLLRKDTIRILMHLVISLKANSNSLHSVLIPMLMHVTEDNEDEDDNILLEDALELWYYTLENCSMLNNELIQMFPRIFTLVQSNMNFYEVLGKIFNSYLLFRPDIFHNSSAELSGFISYSFKECSDNALPVLSNIINTLFRLHPNPVTAFEVNILEILNEFRNEHQDKIKALLTVHIGFLLMTRFQDMLNFFGKYQVPKTDLMECMLEYFDNIHEMYSKKTVCIGLIHMFGVLDMQELKIGTNELGVATQLFSAVNSCLSDHCSDDKIIPHLPASEFPNENVWIEFHRIQRMIMEDPSISTDLHQLVVTAMNSLASKFGNECFQMFLTKIDPLILQEFQKFQLK